MSSMWNNAINLISLLPSSYLPGLMVEVVKVGYAKNVFVPGGASRLIQKVEADLPPNTQLKIDGLKCNCINGIPQTSGGCPVHGVKY